MAAWRDSINVTTEVAFADAPLAASPTWTDISAYVRGIPRIFHGKTSEEGSVAPSTMTLVLSNRDRRFDPDYSSGPYYGNLVPMKKIRVTVALGAFSAVVFTGFVSGWKQEWQNRADGTVEIQARSGFQFISNEKLPASAYAVEVLADDPTHYWPLQGGELSSALDGGASLSDSSSDQGGSSTDDGTYPLGESDLFSATSGGSTVTLTAPLSVLGSTVPAAVELWVRTPANIIVSAVVATDDNIELLFGGSDLLIDYSDDTNNLMFNNETMGPPSINLNDGNIHHVVVYRSGSNLVYMVDGSILATEALDAGTNSASPTGIQVQLVPNGASPALSHLAFYDTAPSADRFNVHYQVGKYAFSGSHGIYGRELSGARLERILDDASWPTGDRDVDAGHSDTGPYLPASRDPLSMMREIELAECGLLYFDTEGKIAFRDRSYFWTDADTGVVFSDDGASTAVKYAELQPDGNSVETIRNIVTTNYGQSSRAATRRDNTSVAAYGASSQDDSCPTITTRTDASNRSAYILREKKDPTTRITRLVVHLRHPAAARTTTQVENVLGLQLGQVVTIEYTPMGLGSQVVKKAMVLGIEHDVTMGQQRQWTTSLYLSPAPSSNAEAPYLTLGDATYGRIGAAAGNLIPY